MGTPAPYTARDLEMTATETLSTHAKSFWLAAMFLPKGVAEEAAVLYRFCRTVDDIADHATCVDEAYSELKELQHECVTGWSSDPSVRGFVDVATQRGIPKDTAVALIDGVLSDLGTVRVQTQRDLLRYAYHVAGVVGQMMCGVLRVRDEAATSFAVDLGLAMQLTNICRDVREDAQMGRVYIPNDLLRTHGITVDEILGLSVSDERMKPVIDHLLGLADDLYDRALNGMQYIPIRSRIGILIARRVYRAIGHKLQSDHGSNPFHGRTVVGPLRKCALVLGGFFDLLNPVVLGWRRARVEAHCGAIQWQDLAQPYRLDEYPRLTLVPGGGKQ